MNRRCQFAVRRIGSAQAAAWALVLVMSIIGHNVAPAALFPKAEPPDPDVQLYADDGLVKALLDLKKKEGRDNAMLHYAVAAKQLEQAHQLMDPRQRGQQAKLVNDVCDLGWDQRANALLPYLAKLHPMFERIRTGARLDYARNVGWELGLMAPVPNFLAAQTYARALCAGGLYMESQGKHTEALDNYYLVALTMGRDYGAPAPTLIGGLISVSIQSMALKPIHSQVTSGRPDRATLVRLLQRLQAIEKSQGSFVEMYRGESLSGKQIIKLMRENPEEARKYLSPDFSPLPAEVLADGFRQIDRLEREHSQLWDYLLQFAQTPFWQRDLAAHDRQLEQFKARFHRLTTRDAVNIVEADVRRLVTLAKLRHTQIAAALATYKLDQGRFPVKIEVLVPAHLETLPVDPFSGKALVYNAPLTGTQYTLYSVGPDRTDDGGAILYDPKNGTLSPGDVFFR